MPKEYLELKDHLKEVEEYYQKGLEKIKDYYAGRKENLSLKIPPHEILMGMASKFFLEAIGSRKKIRIVGEDSSLYEVCIGCGTEILMKAIILLKKPEEFIENPEMRYKDVKKIFMRILSKDLDSKQRQRINDVLKLIQFKRNKWAHLSFHRYSAYHEEYQIFNVLEYLYLSYFPDSEILKEIKSFKEQNKVTSGLDFEPVEFN